MMNENSFLKQKTEFNEKEFYRTVKIENFNEV